MNQINLKYFILNDPKDVKVNQCQYPECMDQGRYKAPKSPQNLKDYYWFCLPHIRDYNAKWDYYKDMTPSQIEAHLRADALWQKPTWPFGHHPHQNPQPSSKPSVPPKIQEALYVLELEFPFTLDQLRARYKKLVKKYHPDLHGIGEGFCKNTEMLKKVNNAYAIVRDYLLHPGKSF